MREAREWLARAAELHDALPELGAAGPDGPWCARALGAVRGSAVPPNLVLGARAEGLASLVARKYAACAAAALAPVLGAWVTGHAWLLVAAPVVFYLVEAQWVFLVPVALDGAERPFAAARALTRRAGGTLRVASNVVPLAACMLGGGFAGAGFARSWRIGCLAVLVGYERLLAGRGALAEQPA